MKSKKIMGLIVIGATLVASICPAFAEYNPNKVITGDVHTLYEEEAVPTLYPSVPLDSVDGLHLNIVVNGKGLDFQETKAYIKDNDATMIPLKLVSEALGYEVKWNGETRAVELKKGAHWTMVKIGEDRYTFAKMAPISLGTAPEIKDGTTYVPLNFVTDILKADVMRDETGTISIGHEKISALSIEGNIIEVQKTDKNTRIHIKSVAMNKGAYDEIILNISENTKMENPLDHTEISIEDLKEGDTVRAVYGPMVTRSLPPIGNAEKIEILQGVTVREGTITDVKIDDKHSSILIGSMEDGVILMINEDTKIVTEDNKEIELKDLKKGMNITAYHSLIMTLSLPGMTEAKKIVVNK
ncbi:copper amine oxidase N-terminal domain-containing protein [Lutibacter sp. B2]|nr:copper amine oxidase N-terminal domain-containing protein [Lutibacter sp. B2]